MSEAKLKTTAGQLEFLDWEFGAFFHFGIRSFFMGQGLVAQAAYAAGKVFYGSDMNRNRLAVAISKVAKRGGEWTVTK